MSGNDSFTKLLLHADGADNSTTFTDSSAAAHAVTAVGNAKIATRQFNNTAGYFNGTTDYVTIPDHADWDFGTGDFTVECWVKFNSWINANSFFDRNGTLDFTVGYSTNAGRGNVLFIYIANTYTKEEAWAPVLNTWYHVAFVRVSGVLHIYADGAEKGTGTANTTNISYTSLVNIGRISSSAYWFNGWMKEMRVSNSARYTTTFTPSTTQFVSDANTKLLLHFDTPALTPINSCGYFDGTGDYLGVADHADWDFGTGDFTVEGFINFSSIAATTRFWEIGPYTAGVALLWTTAGNTGFDFYINNTLIEWAFSPVINRWYHIVVVRVSGQLKCFVDGVSLSADVANSGNITGNMPVQIGLWSTGSTQGLVGWMKEFRISNSARYTANFTPTQTPFVSDANTKLLLHMDATPGTTTFTDSGNTVHTITTNGNTKQLYISDYRERIFKDDGNTVHLPVPVGGAKIDWISVFGSGAAILDGDDYLTTPDHADWDFDADFTVDLWYRINVIQVQNLIGNGYTTGWALQYNSALSRYELYIANAVRHTEVLLSPVVVNTWYHITVVRSSGNIKIYSNGYANTAQSSYATGTTSAGVLGIGYDSGYAGFYIFGKIDEPRVSKGIARWTANFIPPTAEYSGAVFSGLGFRGIIE